MTPPRIHASTYLDAVTDRRPADTATRTTPEVDLKVTFDHGDWDTALAALETAAAKVRAQIESTRPGLPTGRPIQVV